MAAAAPFLILAEEARAEIEVLKSRFLAVAVTAASEAQAHALVERERERHPEASHHCYAFLVGPPGTTRCIGYSDAGEPHNTAGKPMFDVLLHSGLGDVACVVTRWFGGTKLGRGGLARAYGDAVQAALRIAERTEKVDWVHRRLVLDYGRWAFVERQLGDLGAEVVEQAFDDRVRVELRVPAEGVGRLEAALGDATKGRVIVEPVDDELPPR